MKAAAGTETGMEFAQPHRTGLAEFLRDRDAFDGVSYLYANEDVRREIGYDPDGAWRHWLDVGHVQDRYPNGVARAAPRKAARDGENRPFGLNVFGPFDAISGLGTAARNLAAAVAASGVPYELRPHDVETGHARVTEAEAARPLAYAINLVLANADQIRRLAGLYPDGCFDGAYTIAVWAWELPSFRADFFAAFALVDEVWPNSRFELAAIAAVSPVPVHLMPIPVVLPGTTRRAPGGRAGLRARFGLPAGAFVFLCPFDAGSVEQRKNPFAALRAFRAAFGDDPRRVLVVKHHSASTDLARRIERARAGAANIRVIGARLDEGEMAMLREASDALISTHRAEGFGLNLAEFLARGKAVVATDTSGNRDFLDAETGFPIPCWPREIVQRSGPYLEHAVWAEPDEAAIAPILRRVASDRAVRETRGHAAADRMARDFSAEAIGRRMRDRLAALGSEAAARIAATGAVSTARHVPPHPGRERLRWPARLPLISVLLADPGEGMAATLASLREQLYPFWEACVAARDWPPPEDAAARAACRHGDLRVRLVDVPPAAAPPADALPLNAQPADALPADTPPVDALPAGTPLADAQPADAQPADAQPADAQPADADRVDADDSASRGLDADGDGAGGDAALLRAAEASIGAFVLLLPPGATLDGDALMRAAHALDRADAPDLLSLETHQAAASGLACLPPYPAHLAGGTLPVRPVLARKSLLLRALCGVGVGGGEPGAGALLRRMAAEAGGIAHLGGPVASLAPHAPAGMRMADAKPDAGVGSQMAVSLRIADPADRGAWLRSDLGTGPADLDVLALADEDFRAVASRVLRAATAEHIVFAGPGVVSPAGGLARALGWLSDRRHGCVVATFGGEDFDLEAASLGLFATTRTTLARVALLRERPRSPAAAIAMLGLRVVAPPDLATARARLPVLPDPAGDGDGERGGGSDASGRVGSPGDGGEESEWPTLSTEAHVAHLRGTGLFDPGHYLVASPDVAAAGLDPVVHYCEHGWREHRAPNFYFDPVWYRACYMRDSDDVDPLIHWERYRNSGVRPARHFDPAWVRRSAHLPPDVDPLWYFLGHRERHNVSPLREFDPAWYRARRRDIAYRGVDPFEHYMRFGAAEGVNPSADFDTAYYAANHMLGIGRGDPVLRNPLLHYLENADRAPVITSQKAALRQEIGRLALLGVEIIDLGFAWYDGLPQRIDALRAYLGDPTLHMSFRLVFANERLIRPQALLERRLSTALRAPYEDDFDDADICERIAECFSDARCLREDGRPVLAVARGGGGAAVEAFAQRIAGKLRTLSGIDAALTLID